MPLDRVHRNCGVPTCLRARRFRAPHAPSCQCKLAPRFDDGRSSLRAFRYNSSPPTPYPLCIPFSTPRHTPHTHTPTPFFRTLPNDLQKSLTATDTARGASPRSCPRRQRVKNARTEHDAPREEKASWLASPLRWSSSLAALGTRRPRGPQLSDVLASGLPLASLVR